MGFPESFTWPQPHARKRTCQHAFGEGHIYRQLGNAVCPPVVHAIAEQMLLAMGMADGACLGAQEASARMAMAFLHVGKRDASKSL
jgi:hypothetical protein